MKTICICLLRCYQIGLSPLIHALSGPLGGCRFSPTCSQYAINAYQEHPFWRASWLTIRRLARCHPWGGSGHDPVPPKQSPHDNSSQKPSPETTQPKP